MAEGNVCTSSNYLECMVERVYVNPPIWDILTVVLVFFAAYVGAYFGSQSSPHTTQPKDSVDDTIRLSATATTPSTQSSTSQELENNTTQADDPDSSSLPSAFVCCITSELFVDPVVASDGHSYENAAITRWFERHHTSPKTGERVISKTLVPNHNLRSQVIEYRRSEGLPEIPPWQPQSVPQPSLAPTEVNPAENDPRFEHGVAGGGGGGGGGHQRFHINVNIPRAELSMILRDIVLIFSRVPHLLHQLNLEHVPPPQREQSVIRNPAALGLLAEHARSSELNMEEAAVRFSRLQDHLNRIFQETMRRTGGGGGGGGEVGHPVATPADMPTTTPGVSPPAVPTSSQPPPDTTAPSVTPTPPNTTPTVVPPSFAPPDEPPIFRAARAGDASGLLRELIAVQRTVPQLFTQGTGNPIDRPRNGMGHSLLMVAAVAGREELVRTLCNDSFTNNPMLPMRGGPADPALPSPRDSATALHCAALGNHVGCIKALVEIVSASQNSQITTDIYVNQTVMSNGETPLHQAAFNGSSEAVAYLIDHASARVDMVRNDGCSALHLAAAKGHLSSVVALLERGASRTLAEFPRHLTPIHLAARSGCDRVLKLLLETNEETNPPSSSQGNATPPSSTSSTGASEVEVEERKSLVNIKAKQNIQPLHLAAVGGHGHTCALLLTFGADIQALTSDNHTPLSLACHHLKTAAVTTLIAAGASATNMGGSENGRSPLELVLLAKHHDIAMALINAGVDVLKRTANGSTSLHLACWSGLREVAIAILDKHPELLKLTTEDGDTALHQAAYNGYVEVCELLLDRGAEVNAPKLDQNTPLHLGARRGMAAVARVLLDRGADLSLKNVLLMDPLEVARRSNQPNVVAAIQEAMARRAVEGGSSA